MYLRRPIYTTPQAYALNFHRFKTGNRFITFNSLWVLLIVCIYVCVCVCMYVCMYVQLKCTAKKCDRSGVDKEIQDQNRARRL